MQFGPASGDDAREPSFGAIERIALAGAIALGAVLRFWTRSHLWLDEALSVDIARLPLGDIPDALRHDGHPPLYYFLLHGWMAVVGEGDSAVRALSGIIGLATLPLAWFAGRRVGGRLTAWALVAVFALSPFAIRYSTETRMYALVMFLVFAGYLLIANALERSSRLLLAGIAVVTGALLLTHYWALWLSGAVLLALGWRARSISGDARRRAVKVIVAVLAGGVFFVPWLGVMLDQAAHTGTPWAAPARPTTIVTTTLQDFGGGDFAEGLLLGWGLMGLLVLGLTARPLDRNRLELDVRTQPRVRPEAAVVGVTIAIASVAGYVTSTTYATRYAAVFFPLFALVAAYGITRITGRVAHNAIAAVVLALGIVGGLHNTVTERTQTAEAAKAIRAEAQPGDVVVICPDQLGPSVQRLLPPSLGLVELAYPKLNDPALVDWRDYADRNESADPAAIAEEVVARARGAHAVFLVVGSGYKTFGGQCEAMDAELARHLGARANLVFEDGDEFFEHAALVKYPGPTP